MRTPNIPTGTRSWHWLRPAALKVLEGRARTVGPAWRGSSPTCNTHLLMSQSRLTGYDITCFMCRKWQSELINQTWTENSRFECAVQRIPKINHETDTQQQHWFYKLYISWTHVSRGVPYLHVFCVRCVSIYHYKRMISLNHSLIETVVAI